MGALSCLSYELGWRRDAGETASLDGEILDRYASDLDNIASKRQAMEIDMAQYKQEKARNPFYDNEGLRDAITGALRKLYVLLGCAVRLKLSNNADINAAFRPLGLFSVLPRRASQSGSDHRRPHRHDRIFADARVRGNGGRVSVRSNRRVAPSENFPNDALQPLMWSLSATFAHGVAILTADWMRVRLLRKGRWFAMAGRERRPIAANYIRVALGCAIAGYIALFYGAVIFQPPTVAFAKGTVPYALLPAATGAFYGYHLDNVDLGSVPHGFGRSAHKRW